MKRSNELLNFQIEELEERLEMTAAEMDGDIKIEAKVDSKGTASVGVSWTL